MQFGAPQRKANAEAMVKARHRKHGICGAASWRGIFRGRNGDDTFGEERHSLRGRVDPPEAAEWRLTPR